MRLSQDAYPGTFLSSWWNVWTRRLLMLLVSCRGSKSNHHEVHWSTEISALLYALGTKEPTGFAWQPGFLPVLIDLDVFFPSGGSSSEA
ncbi:hypothetical protein CONLIGDRAFT_440094 [Coniochaeta ligniaria NRRL 30616]|uniref:Uncharacterized protein n=1 Tax=Coniochaeta ligniaria NRRL 30616 TaxID=1408157 RepID=A0A1J7J2M4_9PEZI|nr:hypothetical protein CONLIGDRAFT_440094 [Coniochaeta ligniaria NRRL 30616]